MALTLTKCVTMNFDKPGSADPQYITDRDAHISTFIEAGTTDGAWTGTDTTGIRHFTTQEAAESFLSGSTAINAKYGRNVVSSTITDI